MTRPPNAACGSSAALAALTLLLGACAGAPPVIPEPLLAPRAEYGAPGLTMITEAPEGGVLQAPAPDGAERSSRVQLTPTPPPAGRVSTLKPEAPAGQARPDAATITVAFDQMPLPNFVQAVYGLILKKTYSLDPLVAARKELVTLRATQPQTPDQLENAARLLLKTYGVAVTDLGAGNYRFSPDNAQTGYAPDILRGRALPEVPLRMRPIYQLVELQAVRTADIAGWLIKIFGPKVTITEDSARNTLILSGQSDDVAAALGAIEILDQPLMKGRQSLRINPVFWTADELSKRLTELLTAEGYGVTSASGQFGQFPINLIPISGINALVVFAADPAVMQHIVKWANELDQPTNARSAGGGGYFTYQARYTNAQSLANTMQAVLGEAQAAAPAQNIPVGAVVVGAPPKIATPGRVIVDTGTNTLIFQGSQDSNAKLLGLLQEIDKPARSVLIEVTVAEVSLDDRTQLGVEWAFANSGAKGLLSGGTLGGLSIGAGGLAIRGLNSAGDVRLLLNLLATNSRANVLSSPRIMARNGEVSTIQVGSEIPTITSVQTTPATGASGVLQSVQYRKTGIILTVKPTIYSGDRIDLDVSQEVSDSTKVGAAGSPIIDTRKVETKLSLKDGSAVLLGGLIQQNTSRSETGIPLLKDIPAVGQLFRTNIDTGRKTELLVLITPYIVADDHDARAITAAFRGRLGDWAQPKLAPTPVKNTSNSPPAAVQ